MNLQTWENSVLGQHLDSDGVKNDVGQCSQVPISWAENLYPGVSWSQLLPESTGVVGWAGRSTKYFGWIANNPKDPNQLPLPGDIVVFGATPAKGYTMTFANPYGHAGVIKSASTSGYTLIEQNEPLNSGVHDTSYPWTLRPCLGWFRPANQVQVQAPIQQLSAPVPAPTSTPVLSTNVGKQLVFPASVKGWWTYNEDGPYDNAHHAHLLTPNKYGGYSKPIVKDLGNGLYVINTDAFGRQAVWGTAPLTVS